MLYKKVNYIKNQTRTGKMHQCVYVTPLAFHLLPSEIQTLESNQISQYRKKATTPSGAQTQPPTFPAHRRAQEYLSSRQENNKAKT